MSRNSIGENRADAAGPERAIGLGERCTQTAPCKRRVQIVLLAGCILLASIVASWAQSSRYRIGVLTPGGPPRAVFLGARDSLERIGADDQLRFSFVVEDSEGPVLDLRHRVKSLLDANPAVVIAVTTAHAVALKEATNSVPIVFAWVGDPIGSGLASSYRSSGNNLTGVTNYAGPLLGKRLAILKEMAPRVTRVLVLVDPSDAGSRSGFEFLQSAAKKLGVKLERRDATSRQAIKDVMAATPKGAVDALFFTPSVLIGTQVDLLLKKAREDKVPLVAAEAAWVERGALYSYAADFRLVGAQAARLVAKILAGAKPSDIPIETPEKFSLTVNLTTAREIGIKIPRSVLEKIDRVID